MFAPCASIVLGIDPGLTRCGYAVLRVSGNTEVSMSALGVLRTSPEKDLPNRLAEIAGEIEELLRVSTICSSSRAYIFSIECAHGHECWTS